MYTIIIAIHFGFKKKIDGSREIGRVLPHTKVQVLSYYLTKIGAL